VTVTKRMAAAVAAVAGGVGAPAAQASDIGRTMVFHPQPRVTLAATLVRVVDPLREPANDFHSRPPSNGRHVGIRLRVTNRGPGSLGDYGVSTTLIDSRRREAHGWTLIGWGCDSPFVEFLADNVTRRGCDAFSVVNRRRPARYVIYNARGKLAEWRLR
jgi:hypothetical protein